MTHRRRLWRHPCCLPLLLVIAIGCGDDTFRPVPVSVQVDGPQLLTAPGQEQFTAIQTWSDGSTVDVTAAARWTSTNPSVLSVAGGLATAFAAGEVGLSAAYGQHFTQPRTVLVVPDSPEWNGTYTLTVGGESCAGSMPPELRQRTFIAVVAQNGLTLNVDVPDAGSFGGRIFNPQVRFSMTGVRPSLRSGPVLRRIAATHQPRFGLARFERTAWPVFYGDPLLIEVLPDGNRLSIDGEAVTTISPSGFTGGFAGSLTLSERGTGRQLAICSSSSHPFTLARR